MPRFRVLGCVAKKRTRDRRGRVVPTKNLEPLKNALVMRFVIKVVPRVVHLVVHRENCV